MRTYLRLASNLIAWGALLVLLCALSGCQRRNSDDIWLWLALLALWPSPALHWEQIGPQAGFIPAIRYRPGHSGEVWLSGDDGTGLYRSVDDGGHWQQVTGAPPNHATYALRFRPGNANRILAPNHFGRGMLASSDGGITWTADQAGLPITGNDNQLLYDLAISPVNPDVLLAATNSGLYRSTDDGASFTLLSPTGLSGDNKFRSLAFRNDGALFAGKSDGWFGFSGDNGSSFTQAFAPGGISLDAIEISGFWIYVGFKNGTLFRLDVNTLASTLINDTSQAGSILNANYLRLHLLPGSNATSDRLLVATSGNSAIAASRYGLFLSADSGATFSGILTGEDIFSASFNPNNPSRLIAGSGSGRGVFVSDDSGNNWQLSNQGLYASASIGFATDPSDPSHLLVSNSAGSGFGINQESFDGGLSWNEFADPTPDDGVFALDVSRIDPSAILAGMLTQGIWRSVNGSGGPWVQVAATAGRVDDFQRDAVQTNIVYATVPDGAAGSSLYFSNTNGASFTARTGIVAWAMASHPHNSMEGIVVNGTDAYRSVDGFVSTTALGLAPLAGGEGGFTVVAYNASHPVQVIVGGASGGLYYTDNYSSSGTPTWRKLSTPIQSIGLRGVAIVSRAGRTVIYAATFGGQTAFGSASTFGVFRSMDLGATWERISDRGLFPSMQAWRLRPIRPGTSEDFHLQLWSGGLFRLHDPE